MKEWHKVTPLLREQRQLGAAFGAHNSLGEGIDGQSRMIISICQFDRKDYKKTPAQTERNHSDSIGQYLRNL